MENQERILSKWAVISATKIGQMLSLNTEYGDVEIQSLFREIEQRRK